MCDKTGNVSDFVSSPLSPACHKSCEPCDNEGKIETCARIAQLFRQQLGIRRCDGPSSSAANSKDQNRVSLRLPRSSLCNRDEDHDTRRYQPRLLVQHPEISAFAQGRTQRIGSAPPSKQAREAASPRLGHNRPHKVMIAHLELLPETDFALTNALVSDSAVFHRSSRHSSAENVSAALTSTFRPARSSDTTYSLPFVARLIAPASSPSCHNTCNAGASGTVSHVFMIRQPAKLMMTSRPRSGKTVYSSSALTHWASQLLEHRSLFQWHRTSLASQHHCLISCNQIYAFCHPSVRRRSRWYDACRGR